MLNFSKMLHSNTGKFVMSILLGIGLASVFRKVCKGSNCIVKKAPHQLNKVYRVGNNKCVKFHPSVTKCSTDKKIYKP